MERKLGEIFEFEDYFKKEKIKLKVVESDSCTCCHFNYACTEVDEIQLGKCLDTHREDGKNIVFKEVDTND